MAQFTGGTQFFDERTGRFTRPVADPNQAKISQIVDYLLRTGMTINGQPVTANHPILQDPNALLALYDRYIGSSASITGNDLFAGGNPLFDERTGQFIRPSGATPSNDPELLSLSPPFVNTPGFRTQLEGGGIAEWNGQEWRRISGGPVIPGGVPGPVSTPFPGGGFNFDSLSDADLLAMAGQFGIDTTPFVSGGGGGLLGQVGQVPGFNTGLPSASLQPPNAALTPTTFNQALNLPPGQVGRTPSGERFETDDRGNIFVLDPTGTFRARAATADDFSGLPPATQFGGGIPALNAPFAGASVAGSLPNFGAQAPVSITTGAPSGAQFLGSLGLNVGAPEVTVSPEARALVSQEFNAARQKGTENIRLAAIGAAGRRGLNVTDTPIFDPLLRAQAELETQLGGQEAQSILGLSQNLRDFLQQQALSREQAIQGRFGLESGQALSQAQLLTQRDQLLEAARQARDRGDETRAQIFEQAAQGRANLAQRAGEFQTTAGLQQGQFLEGALQGRFGLEAQQQAQRQASQLGLLGLGEQARQFGGQFGLNLAGLQEQATQNRFNLGNQALLGRASMLQGVQQFQQAFQQQLQQQAFQNRLQLAGQLGQTGLGLSGQRFGTPTSTTQIGPLNLGQGFSAIGLGLSGMQGSGFF